MCSEVVLGLDYTQIKCVIIASPGFVKDEFFLHLKDVFKKEECTKLVKEHQIKSKIILAHSNTGYLDAL